MSKYEGIEDYIEYVQDKGILVWRAGRSGAVVGSEAGWVNKDGYRQLTYKGKSLLSHRVVLYLLSKLTDDTLHVDHIDGDKINNKVENLRLVNNRQNHQNKKCHREGALLGAHKARGGRWSSSIYIGGKSIYLGSFDTPQEAHETYMNALTQEREIT